MEVLMNHTYVVSPRFWVHVGFAVLLLALFLGGSPTLAATVDLVTGVASGVGIAFDPANNNIYYLEWNAGTLKRIHITPGCDHTSPATCPINTVATGFHHPEDVALDLDHGLAYITTRDDPGTTGAFWSVNLTTTTKSLVTFNLGAPHQIVLDTPTNSAYVVAFDSGKVWRIDLSTGAKVALMTGLGHPVGLALTADRTRGYVTQQTPALGCPDACLTEIDLALHARIRDVATGLTAPFYLAWTDPAQYALYLVERDPANDVLRVDLPSSTKTPVINNLPFRPSGIAVNLFAGVAYVTTGDRVLEVGLATLPMGEPVFLGVGNVPSTKIGADGYATTDPGYFFSVKDAPFGGTLNILGNLSNYLALGATHYQVLVSYEGGPATPLTLGWNTYHWNTTTNQYDLTPVAPDPAGGTGSSYYAIPSDYSGHAERWYPSFLMMQWPSGSNGLYKFSVNLFKKPDFIHPLSSTPVNSLAVLIDNSPATVDVVALRQGSSNILTACSIVSSGPTDFFVEVTAYDPNHHLLDYRVTAMWGHNASDTFFYTSYTGSPPLWPVSHVDEEGPRLWSGVVNSWVPAGTVGWQAHCSCAYTFYLDSWKRTIDGYNRLLYRTAHQSISINNAGPSCQ
jgi:DNA-binding beta-propeller fold protein YncE